MANALARDDEPPSEPGKPGILSRQRNHPVIVPISGQRLRSTIPRICCMDVVSGSISASSASPTALSISRRHPARPHIKGWPRRATCAHMRINCYRIRINIRTCREVCQTRSFWF